MPETPFFNLVDEPWLQVLDQGGRRTEVSLVDAFARADELGELVGEVPTQAFANLRLLLAIAYRALDGPQDPGHWAEIAATWNQTVALVADYLDDVHERFWLVHPSEPFFQVADLHTAKGGVSGLEKLIADVPNGEPFLTSRLGRSLESIGWSEAARWLVHVHAFDPSGIRSGAVGDPRVKADTGKGYPIGTGWAGQIGGIHAVGRSLRETLLLNLVTEDDLSRDAVADLPPWERPALTAAPDLPPGVAVDGIREPRGPVDLYTWQARRVRLTGDERGVTGLVLAQGDKALPQNRFTVEPLTAWRYSEPQSKKLGTDTYMPREHNPSRALWRGLSAYLPKRESRSERPPMLTRWLSEMINDGLLPGGQLVLRAIGLKYGSNNSVVDELVDDRLVLPTALLDSEHLTVTAESAISVAEEAVRTLAGFATNLFLAAGGSTESDGPRELAREQAYATLDGEFRTWVVTLERPEKHVDYLDDWRRRVRKAVLSVADEIVLLSGPTARAGRHVRGRHLDAGLAELWFRRGLAQLLPGQDDEARSSTAVVEGEPA
jgi:CRISPR system Cascade subunit CasA